MSKIIPSILEKTEEAVTARVRLIEQVTDEAHLDVLDHTFLAYRSFHDPAFITGLNSKLRLDVHLMTNATAESIQVWNVPWVNRIYFHLKAVEDPRGLAQAVRSIGKIPALVLDPEASLLEAKQFVNDFDVFVIMGVPPGRSGQPIVPSTVDKIKRLHAIAPNATVIFDGGVTVENVASIARAGAAGIVVGNALPRDTFVQAYEELTQLTHAKGKISQEAQVL